MFADVGLILPALNEEPVIAVTLEALRLLGLGQIIVVDNGSTDRTADSAAQHRADVVSEPRRGYGWACLAGMAALKPHVRLVAFMDADGSDDPADFEKLIAPIRNGQADMVIGSRTLGRREQGSVAPHQHLGNRLATSLLRWLYGARFTDLGPFRVIRREALERLHMRDTNFGWTVEMQIKAHRQGLRIVELPVSYRKRRLGESKISGTIRGSIGAGTKIIWTIAKYRFAGQRPTPQDAETRKTPKKTAT
jgi:glycosyltransferase involved in cell wall biosynthesis